MSKTKTKAIFVGETLRVLRELSAVFAMFDPGNDSIEIRADQLFKDDPGKKGKTAKEKLYLFTKAVNLGEGEPLFIEKKFGQFAVRPDIATKEEVIAVLKEAGITNASRIFERAKAHLQGKATEGVAAKPAAAKGKPEHADPFRGARSARGRWRGEGPPPVDWEYTNNFTGEPQEDYANWRRAHPKKAAEHDAYYSGIAEEARKRKESFEVEAPRVWAETHPGEPYPPRDPGWQWVPEAHSWQYFRAAYNPFYNNAQWSRNRGRGEGAPEPSASARSEKAIKPCETILAEHGISVADKTSFRKWALENHPDKGGDENVFKEVSGCWTSLTKGGTRRNRKNRRKARKTRRR